MYQLQQHVSHHLLYINNLLPIPTDATDLLYIIL